MIIKDIQELKKIAEELKNQGKTIARTNGCFDLMHPGHISTFQKAKEKADVLIVGVNGDQSPYRSTKPGRPINTINFRADMLAGVRYIDYVFIYEEETPAIPINTIVPHVLIKGGDYGDIQAIVGYDIVVSNGGEVMTVPLQGEYSTSNIIRKILHTYTNNE